MAEVTLLKNILIEKMIRLHAVQESQSIII